MLKNDEYEVNKDQYRFPFIHRNFTIFTPKNTLFTPKKKSLTPYSWLVSRIFTHIYSKLLYSKLQMNIRWINDNIGFRLFIENLPYLLQKKRHLLQIIVQ